MKKLNNIQSIGSFLRTKNGFKVTNPEGYVAIKQGGAVKLVDRLEFSRGKFQHGQKLGERIMAEEEVKKEVKVVAHSIRQILTVMVK